MPIKKWEYTKEGQNMPKTAEKLASCAQNLPTVDIKGGGGGGLRPPSPLYPSPHPPSARPCPFPI